MIVVDNTGVQLLVTNEGMLPFRDPFMPLHRIKKHMHYNSDPCTLGFYEEGRGVHHFTGAQRHNNI